MCSHNAIAKTKMDSSCISFAGLILRQCLSRNDICLRFFWRIIRLRSDLSNRSTWSTWSTLILSDWSDWIILSSLSFLSATLLAALVHADQAED